MTVDGMIERLMSVSAMGMGDLVIETWDPDAGAWMSVTGFTYGKATRVRLYTDGDEEDYD